MLFAGFLRKDEEFAENIVANDNNDLDDESDDGDPGVGVELEEIDKEPHQAGLDDVGPDAGAVEFECLEGDVFLFALEDEFAIKDVGDGDGNDPADGNGDLKLAFITGVKDGKQQCIFDSQ